MLELSSSINCMEISKYSVLFSVCQCVWGSACRGRATDEMPRKWSYSGAVDSCAIKYYVVATRFSVYEVSCHFVLVFVSGC